MPITGPAPARFRCPHTLVFALVVLLVGSACADRSTPDFRGRPAGNGAIVVDVRNQHFADITVRVSRGGAWQRIGSVTGNSTNRLQIPSALADAAGDYRFRVHAIGSPDDTDYVTGRIPVNPGNVIELTVAPVLRMSSWSIRN